MTLEMTPPEPGGDRHGRKRLQRRSGDQQNHYSTTDRPAEKLLDRLDAVKETGPDRWTARCPAHDDRHPSLSVRELPDGTILVKCFPGCSAAEVVAAVGLSLADLFPQDTASSAPHRRRDPRAWAPMDALRCLSREGHVILLAGEALHRGEVLGDADRARLVLAVGRLGAALDAVGGRTS